MIRRLAPLCLAVACQRAVTAPRPRDASVTLAPDALPSPCPAGDLARCRSLALAAIERHDDLNASRLALSACNGGHLPACRTLGWLHENGRGVTRELTRARALYRRACEGGEMESCKSLGFLFDTATPPDRARAATLYQRACEGGVLEACNNLANLYLGGDGVTRDIGRAIALYDRVCAAGGHERACGNAQSLRALRDGGSAPDAPLANR